MIDVSLETNPEMYKNYRKCLSYLWQVESCNYEFPDEVVPFHIYTEVRTEKELLAIKSYIATQDLDRTKLIVWSDYDISNQENIQPYKEHLDLRVYDAVEEAKGTPLEGIEKYTKIQDDHNHYMSSGVLRFLVLYKYGGIYMDMDMVLLRDFRPILGQDFAYQWGSSTDFAKERRWEPDCNGPCAAMLGAVKGSEFIELCIEEVKNTIIQPLTTCFDEDMLARVYARNPDCFTIFPSPFFNTEWLMSKVDKELVEEVEASWFDKPLKDQGHLFLNAFAWHWHNSANKHKIIVKGSKFDLLNEWIDGVIKLNGSCKLVEE